MLHTAAHLHQVLQDVLARQLARLDVDHAHRDQQVAETQDHTNRDQQEAET